ncbi:hypothetical protein DPMN_134908 [Dreissena polymorpha]|uniref:Uncharacterized protein n=1 Tax=Dreissena polymorpha TaxID=45954 RepID=A0A9D4JCB8_DREPO|nr:hypothetical protein DPMN_134908 [Dreissena polymorpha]
MFCCASKFIRRSYVTKHLIHKHGFDKKLAKESVKELIINAETEHVERHHTPEKSHQVTIVVEKEEVTQHRIPLTESCFYSDISDDEIDFGNLMDSVIVWESRVGMSSTSFTASLGEEQGILGSPSPSSSLPADDESDFGNWLDSVIVGEPPGPHVVGMRSTSSTASLGEVQGNSASPSPSSSLQADEGLLFYEPTLYEVYQQAEAHTSSEPCLDLVPFYMIEPEEATGDNDIPQFSGNEETVVELINVTFKIRTTFQDNQVINVEKTASFTYTDRFDPQYTNPRDVFAHMQNMFEEYANEWN